MGGQLNVIRFCVSPKDLCVFPSAARSLMTTSAAGWLGRWNFISHLQYAEQSICIAGRAIRCHYRQHERCPTVFFVHVTSGWIVDTPNRSCAANTDVWCKMTAVGGCRPRASVLSWQRSRAGRWLELTLSTSDSTSLHHYFLGKTILVFACPTPEMAALTVTRCGLPRCLRCAECVQQTGRAGTRSRCNLAG